MSDFELRNLHRQALNDPSLRPKFLELCRKMGKDPQDAEGLAWERNYLQQQAKELKQKQKSFCFRYIENQLRTLPLPSLVICNTYSDGQTFINLIIEEEDEDIRLLDEYASGTKEAIAHGIIMEYLDSFYDQDTSIKFQIINDVFKVFVRKQDKDTKLWDWVETNGLS